MGTGIITALIGLFVTLVTNGVTFFLTRKKYSAEVDSQQIKNMGDSFDTYRKIMEANLTSQKESMEAIISSQNQKIEMLQVENRDLSQQVGQLQMQMINILGNICLDATCKIRKMNFTSDLRFDDGGPTRKEPKQ